MKKTIALLLALAALVAFAACASNPADQQTEPSGSGSAEASATESQTAEETKAADPFRNIDKTANYGGGAFTILTYDAATWNVYLTAESETGSLLNDAAFRRNAEIEEMLKVKIEEVKFAQTQLISKIQAANSSGDGTYDLVCFWATTNLATLITTNAVEDWRKLPFVNLEEPWYNQSANTAFCFAGKQYIAVSDLTYPVQQHFRYLCNLDMLDSLKLPYPYALVDSGDWTIEKLMEYIKNVYIDENNDGVKDASDTYGLVTTVNGTSRLINNWDESPVRTGTDGFIFNLNSDRLQSMVEKMNALQHSPDTYTQEGVNYTIFNSGRALFEVYSSDPDDLRGITFRYAYLPYPKYDENQKDYITVTHGGIMAVPMSCPDLDRAGNIIEAMSAASYLHLKDAFIETYFNNRILRDADSVRMYRLMRDTAYFDVARYVDPSSKLSGLGYYTDLLKSGEPNLQRAYNANGKNIEKKFNELWNSLKGS